ncbi:MAG: hypothetical protein K6U74_09900 [Firmicutes bacterium]|nr:hypothetical protein [Bacillota bacterium]
MAASALYIGGYRWSPIAAAKAEFDVGAHAVAFGAVDYPWGQVLLVDTPHGPRTVLLRKHGFLWRAPGDTYFDNRTDPVTTVGWLSYASTQGQATVFAVKTTDSQVAWIAAGPSSARQRKAIEVGKPVIFSWNQAITWYELQPVAFSKTDQPLYAYRLPKNKTTVGPNDIRWYPVNGPN